MTTPPRSTPPREPGAGKSQQPKEGDATPIGGAIAGGPGLLRAVRIATRLWHAVRATAVRHAVLAADSGHRPARPTGSSSKAGPTGQQPFGMPIGPQQCFMPPGMLPFMPPFGPGPLQWFWSWLMPWWWSWLMSWWVFPGGVGGWQLPPFPNPAQNDMTMEIAASARGVLAKLVRSRGQGRPAGGERQPLAGRSSSLVADAAGRPCLLSAGDAGRRGLSAGDAVHRHAGAQRMPEIDERPEAGGHGGRRAVIAMQQGAQAYRRGRPQSAGEDWR